MTREISCSRGSEEGVTTTNGGGELLPLTPTGDVPVPRIYTSESNPVDYCRPCFPKSEEKAFALHGHDGDGPDGRGNCFAYDAEHPDYEGGEYTCVLCGEKLN